MAYVKEYEKNDDKFYGVWYHDTVSGRQLYLAHRYPNERYELRNAWCLDRATLNKARRRGVWAIGIVAGRGKNKKTYMCHIDDFYLPDPQSFPHPNAPVPQRGIPLPEFRVDTSRSAAYISSAVKLR